jgi:hypothetical protein
MGPDAVTTWLRVTVVNDEGAAFGVPRLLIRRTGGTGTAGAVTWELCYGGLPIATGELGPDQQPVFTEVASFGPSMDGAALTITARSSNGEPCMVEATCVRPARPATRAEATARARWPGVRDQQEPPALRRQFLAGTADVSPGVPAGPGTGPGSRRCVCIYRSSVVLAAFRRRSLRAGPGAAPLSAVPGPSG